MLFSERKRQTPKRSWKRCEVRYGVVRSLHPVQKLYPLIVPELSEVYPNLEYASSLPLLACPDDETTDMSVLRKHHRRQSLLHLIKRIYQPTCLHSFNNFTNITTVTDATLAAASSSLQVVVSAGSSPSFFKYFLVFTAGGLFFSSVITLLYAAYGLGMENSKRILVIVGLVLQRVWISFKLGLSATRMALLGEDDDDNDDAIHAKQAVAESKGMPQGEQETILDIMEGEASTSWSTDSPSHVKSDRVKKHSPKSKTRLKWRKAWKTLKEQLAETRRTATQGVKAMRKERTLYTALVGQQGLVPIQYAVAKLMPFSVSTIMENALRDTLKKLKPSNAIKKMTLKDFSSGKIPPTFLAARVYDVENCIAIDFDVKWLSEIGANFDLYTAGGLARIPVSIKGIVFSGIVRVVLTPLTPDPPGYGATLISFPSPPQLNLDVKVLGGEVTKLPFLRKEITTLMQKSIQENLLWPRRNVVPMLDKGRQILNQAQLQNLRLIDPFLELEQTLVNSEEPMIKDIRERLLPTNQGFDSQLPFVSVFDESLSNSTNSTDVDAQTKEQRNNWFGRFSRAKSSKVLTGDSVLNVTDLSNEEEIENQTIADDTKFSIEARLSTILESITKFLEDFFQNIIGAQSSKQQTTSNTTTIEKN